MTTIKFLHQSQTGGSGLPPVTPNRLGQLILNTARPAMAFQITDDAPQPTISTAVFGPALVTTGQVFPAPRNASIKSCEFMFSTDRGIGPGLFYQEPGITPLTPSSDIIAGSFQLVPNKILLIGPNSNPQTFAAPTSSLVGDTLSLGADSGTTGKRSISIGSSAQPNPVVSNALPLDSNIAIGYKSMTGLFSQAKNGSITFPNSSNVAIGVNSMGVSPLTPTEKSAASNAVVVGYKSGLGFYGSVNDNVSPYNFLAQFTVVGANSWWLKKSVDNKNPWGSSVVLGSKNYQNAYPFAFGSDFSADASCDSAVCIGNNIFSTQNSAAVKFTIIGKQSIGSSSYFTSISTLEAPPAYDELFEGRGFNIANRAISTGPGIVFRRPGTGARGYTFFTITDYRQSIVPPIVWNFSWESPIGPTTGFGPYVSGGLSKQFVQGDGVSSSQYAVASGSFKDGSGKTYTVKNGLITSVA
jgi:hypothetical protein